MKDPITSSIKYNNLNEGNAIKIKINAGVIVQINLLMYHGSYIYEI